MNRRNRFVTQHHTMAAATAITLLLPAAAWADGQAKFKVIDARDGKPLPGATIKIEAGPQDLEDIQVRTAANGTVTTGDLTAGQRKYTIKAIVANIGYKELAGTITILDNQTIEVEIKLEPKGEEVRTIDDKLVRLDTTDPTIYTQRDRGHLQYYPNAIGNRQSLTKSLASVPGLVQNSLNRVHSRGEADGNVLRVDGIQLPSLLAGRAAQFLTPDVLDSLRVRTGGLSPEFGGGSGAVLDIKLRPTKNIDDNPLQPIHFDYAFGAEEYSGNSQTFTVTHQIDGLRRARNGKMVVNPNSRAGYLLNFSRRESENVLASPQARSQMANNSGTTELVTGKFSYRVNPQTEATALFISSLGKTGIANRQGLNASFANRGQGYGFGGNLNRNGLPFVSIGDPNAGNVRVFGASQEVMGNQVSQSDNNRFGGLQLTRRFSPSLKGTVSLGTTNSRQQTTNRNPAAPSVLPTDSSIEYNPTTNLSYNQSQLQADFDYAQEGKSLHSYKFGFLTQDLSGNESYLFQPQSNAARIALQNINSYIGNNLRPDSTGATPTMRIRRTGSYSAFYVQDTYVPTERLRVNVGVRVENFEQTHNINFATTDPRSTFDGKRSDNTVSPRINVLYVLPRNGVRPFGKKVPLKIGSKMPMTVRVGYNRLFTPPGIGQGAVGTNQTSGANPLPVAAQTTNQLDLSLEQQIRNQTLRLSTYRKDIDNTHAWQQMIPGVQSGAFMMVNRGASKVNGFEALYELRPHPVNAVPGASQEEPVGMSGYLSYSNSAARSKGVTSAPLPHDQQQTVNLGVGYQIQDAGSFAFTYSYGSGLQSSIIDPGGKRSPINQLDFRIRTRPKFIGNLHALEIGLENLANSRNILAFNQGPNASAANSFAGTRFQQGRRIVISLFGKF